MSQKNLSTLISKIEDKTNISDIISNKNIIHQSIIYKYISVMTNNLIKNSSLAKGCCFFDYQSKSSSSKSS